MKQQDILYDIADNGITKPKEGGLDINLKRVLGTALKFWYLIVISVLLALVTAYLINRYSTPIYPVRASIIIRQSEENAGAKFLYDNELLNPGRNFYNEIFIMKSYPLLQEVVEELNFDVSFYREGNFKTTEYYDPEFPILFQRLPNSKLPYGRSLNFRVNEDQTYSLELLFEDEKIKGKKFENLHFGDTVKMNGYSFIVRLVGDLSEVMNRLFLVQFTNPFSIARIYSGKLKADWAMPGASVVNVEVNGPVPQKEVRFLNKFIEKYQQYDIHKKNLVATMAMKFLDEQLVVIGDSLDFYEDKVESFKYRNVITTLGNETNRLYQKIQGLEDQKFQFKLKENYYAYVSKLLTNEQYDGIFTPQSVGVTDDVIAGLITRLIDARARMNMYLGVENRENNPLFREHLLRIRMIKDDILHTIDNTRKTEAINIHFINDQIRLVDKELKKLPSSERELVDIQRDYSLKEKLYVFLIQKRTEAGLSKASTTSDIVIVNPPLALGSISPQVERNYLFATAFGLILPLLLFVLFEVLNNRVQSKDDIEKLTTVPLIGGIGHNPSTTPLIVHEKSRSAIAESFRALRSNLNYFTGNKEHQVFMVTSSIPGEGKSFTTLNLATVFAMAGKKTLIIGADLRKPKLYDDLKLANDLGLSQYLSGLTDRDSIIQKSGIENLFLIPGGPMPPNPSELLVKPLMNELIATLRQKFHFIIIDTPPLLFVADAFVLSQYADHTLFVIRQDFTPRSVLRTLDELYSSGKLNKASILFNDLRKSGYGYGYGPTYGYGYNYNGYYRYGTKKQRKGDSGYYFE